MAEGGHHRQAEVAVPWLPWVATRRPGWLRLLVRFARRRPLGAAGGAIVLLMVFAALFADYVAPYDPLATNYPRILHPPAPISGWGPTPSAVTYSAASFTALGRPSW